MILLDTHVAIWLLISPEELSDPARCAISQARAMGDKVACSQVSFYEIANAVRRRRLSLNSSTRDFIAAIQASLEVVPLTTEILILAGELAEPLHADPFDRIIVATAIAGNCTLLTHDGRIHQANICKALW